MTDRRSFLKLFGAGATIVPVIAGVVDVTSPARLVVEPTVEPVTLVTQNVEEAVAKDYHS